MRGELAQLLRRRRRAASGAARGRPAAARRARRSRGPRRGPRPPRRARRRPGPRARRSRPRARRTPRCAGWRCRRGSPRARSARRRARLVARPRRRRRRARSASGRTSRRASTLAASCSAVVRPGEAAAPTSSARPAGRAPGRRACGPRASSREQRHEPGRCRCRGSPPPASPPAPGRRTAAAPPRRPARRRRSRRPPARARLRSRHVICRIGRAPAAMASAQPASALMRTRARGRSVTLSASAQASSSTWRRTPAASAPRGGTSSDVTMVPSPREHGRPATRVTRNPGHRPPLLDQLLGALDRGRGVGRVAVGADRVGVLLGDRRAADHDDHLVPQAGLLQRVDVGLEHRHGRGQERGEADDVGLVLLDRRDELLRRDLHAEVDHVEAGALQHDVDEVLADVVHVALDGAHDERADGLRAGVGQQRAQHLQRAGHGACRRSASRARRSRRARSAHRPPRGYGISASNSSVSGPMPCSSAVVRQLEHPRGVAHQRLVVEGLEDLVLGHHRPPSRPGAPSRAERCEASRASSAPSSSSRSSPIRTVGPDSDQRRHHRAARGVHGRADRGEAGLQLVHRRRPAPLAHPLELPRQRGARRDGRGVQARQAAVRHGHDAPGQERPCRPPTRGAARAVRPSSRRPSRKRPSTCATQAAPSSRGTTRFDGLAGALRQPLQRGLRERGEVGVGRPARGVGDQHGARAQAAVGLPLHEAPALQRGGQPRGRAARQRLALGELAQGRRRVRPRPRPRAAQRPDRSPASRAAVLATLIDSRRG